MKKIVILAIAAAAFIASSVVANAQYRPSSLSRHLAGFEDENGHELTDQEVFQLIGEDIYNETYRGASKQYKTGRTLIIVGAATAGAGLVGTIAGAVATVNAMYQGHVTTYQTKNGQHVIMNYYYTAAPAVVGFAGGVVLLTGGVACLSAGIPLNVIGKKRLEWIANEYNHQAVSGANLRFGLTNYGAGVVLNF